MAGENLMSLISNALGFGGGQAAPAPVPFAPLGNDLGTGVGGINTSIPLNAQTSPLSALTAQGQGNVPPKQDGLFGAFSNFIEKPGVNTALLGGGLSLLSGGSPLDAFQVGAGLLGQAQDRAAAKSAAEAKAVMEEREQTRKEIETAADVGLKGEKAKSEQVDRKKALQEIVKIGADTKKSLASTEKIYSDIADNFFLTTAGEGDPVTQQDYADFVSVSRTSGTVAPVRQIMQAAKDAALRVVAGQATPEDLSNLFATQAGGVDPEAQAAQVRLFNKYMQAGLVKLQGTGGPEEEEGTLGQDIIDGFNSFYDAALEALGEDGQQQTNAQGLPQIPAIPVAGSEALSNFRGF